MQPWKAKEDFAGATQSWTYHSLMQDKELQSLNLLGLTYSTTVRLTPFGKNWGQNRCWLVSVLLDSIGWEENTQRELFCELAALAAA